MMPDREKVIKGLECCAIPHGNCAKCPYEDESLNFAICTSKLCDDALALLKEQEGTINELQNAYEYLQKQFFEVQDKSLKEHEVELCDRCGRRRVISNREVK